MGCRPLTPDDACVVESSACRLETWLRLGREGDDYWVLPIYNLAANLGLSVRARSDLPEFALNDMPPTS